MDHEPHKLPAFHPIDRMNVESMVNLVTSVCHSSFESSHVSTHLLSNTLVVCALTIQAEDDSYAHNHDPNAPQSDNVGNAFYNAEAIIRHWANHIVENDKGCTNLHPSCIETYGKCPKEGLVYRSVMRIVETLFIQLSEAHTDHGDNEATLAG